MADKKKSKKPLEILKKNVSKGSTAGTLRDLEIKRQKQLKDAGA